MRRRPARAVPFLLLSALPGALLAVLLSGCAATGPSSSATGAAAGAGAPGPQPTKAELPAEIAVPIGLRQGDAWKSRFVSTSEMKRTLRTADGKETVKTRAAGLEVVATQKVLSVAGGKARIEVAESSSRILQDGKFIEAPFKRLGPPNPVFFTLDTATGTADFSEMEKAFGDWMDSVKEGPAGDIVGRTFRLQSYVEQIEDLYSKPFNRVGGKTLGKAPKTAGEKEFVLPFLGPGVALGPVPVETTSWYERFEARGGSHLLQAAGKYDGNVAWTPSELADRMADFEGRAPAAYQPSGEAHGRFTSTVDVLSGRELRSESNLRYSASASFEGGTLSEEIAGKSILEPAD